MRSLWINEIGIQSHLIKIIDFFIIILYKLYNYIIITVFSLEIPMISKLSVFAIGN